MRAVWMIVSTLGTAVAGGGDVDYRGVQFRPAGTPSREVAAVCGLLRWSTCVES